MPRKESCNSVKNVLDISTDLFNSDVREPNNFNFTLIKIVMPMYQACHEHSLIKLYAKVLTIQLFRNLIPICQYKYKAQIKISKLVYFEHCKCLNVRVIAKDGYKS